MHAHRRRASGLAALSLVSAGVVLSQAADAPGTAKEPRPASHFRLVLQGVEGAGLKKQTIFGRLFRDSITAREIAPRTVFTYKAGQKLLKQLPPLRAAIGVNTTRLAALEARLADTFSRAEADARYLTRGEAAGLLGRGEAEATYAKQSSVVAGQGTVLRGVVEHTAPTQTTVLTVPGLGVITGQNTVGAVTATFRFSTTLAGTIHVAETGGPGATVSSTNPFATVLGPGRSSTLQIVRPPTVATITISWSSNGVFAAHGIISP